MHNDLLEQVQAQKSSPLPTPPIGWQVNWFEQNKPDLCYAAVVTAVQAPGKLELTVFKPRHFPIHKQGVLHRSHPAHEGRANPATISSGSWDYLPSQRAHKAHYEMHVSQLERREQAILEEERMRRGAEEAKAGIAKEAKEVVKSAK